MGDAVNVWQRRKNVIGVVCAVALSLGMLYANPAPSAAAGDFGTVAGQDLPYCNDNVIPANDDSSSAAVPIPFPLKFFGTPYTNLYVNNNGNITFDAARNTFTPSDITGNTGTPIIAPFFADVDTRGTGSSLVTYGSSPDGSVFCVKWADVGYFNSHYDKLNTFQLLLRRDDTGAGRVAGDFDITFNYDQILWETGDVSGGTNGFGGTSALVGFSAGTGVPGTFVQLPGSLVPGSLINGGPNALIAGHRNSTQVGRYTWQVLNSGLTTSLGNIAGTVVKASDHTTPVVGATVQACTATQSCTYTTTSSTGAYNFSAVLAGNYNITVWPPDASLFGGGATAAVTGGSTTTVPAIQLAAPTPPPAGVTLNSNGTGAGGIPSVHWQTPVDLGVTGCPGTPSPAYTVTLSTGEVIAQGPLIESPAGHYSAQIPSFYPHHGDADITTNVPLTCGGAVVQFNLYIDPSGAVTDTYGRPIGGASVTLLRSEDGTAAYAAVAAGNTAVMSPSNTTNPSTTDANGAFAWDVTPAYYEIQATAPGCTGATSPAMQVPPARLDLVLELTCSAAAPTPTAPGSVSGTPVAGHVISPVGASYASPFVVQSAALYRQVPGGAPAPVALSNGGYTLTAADVGAVFTTVTTAQHPDVVTDPMGAAQHATFQSFSSTSPGVTASAAPPVQVSGVTAPASVKASTKAFILSFTATGGPATAINGLVRVYDGTKLIGTFAVHNGVVRVKLRKRLKKGKHTLHFVLVGSSTSSPAVLVKVIRVR